MSPVKDLRGVIGKIMSYGKTMLADEKLRSRLPRIIVASLGMGAILVAALWTVRPVFEGGYALGLRVAVLIGLVALGMLSYFLLAHLLGAMKFGELRAMMRQRGFT
jgi:putative peptidoglycan lipid II flippase